MKISILFISAALTLLLIPPLSCLSQSEFDSIEIVLEKMPNDTNKVQILNNLCWDFRNSQPEHSIEFGERAIEIAIKLNYRHEMLKAMSFTGVAYRNLGNYPEAFKYFFRHLNSAEEYNDLEQQGYAYINLGNAYIYQKKHQEALKMLQSALPIAKEIKNDKMTAYVLLNLGRASLLQSDHQKALEYFTEALKIRGEINDTNGQGICLKYMGDTYFNMRENTKALQHYYNSLNISMLDRDKDLHSDILNKIASVHLQTRNLDEAIESADKSLSIAKEIHGKLRIKNAYNTLSKIHMLQNNYKKAFEYQSLLLIYKDSLFNEEVSGKIANYQFGAERQRKQAEIDLLNKDKKISAIELKRQYTFNTGLILGLVLVLLLAIVYIRSSINRKKANKVLFAQKQQITDSIHYAKRIQNAILPPRDLFSKNLTDHFILFKPRDIVSGDFYWMTEKGDNLIFTVADCTGHGVPGAFMSMLGISSLNEIINKVSELKANIILNKLREAIIDSLHQTGKEGESKDGMDLALCILNTKTKLLQYAGANNPLYLFRNKNNSPDIAEQSSNSRMIRQIENDNFVMHEIKPDKMPIGIYFEEANEPFTNHEIQLKTGDSVVIFTDGYADQFGGPKGKKFKYNSFRQILIDNQDHPMNKQRDILNQTLIDWQAHIDPLTGEKQEQLDDIVIVGIRI